jgi:hypothetical protein
MKSGKAEKFKNMTVRINDATDTKFGMIWNILQSHEPPQIRLSRNDVFATMVREYYQVLKREEHILGNYIPPREIE